MTKRFRELFIAERARALAIMYLTRRDDLVIRDAREEMGLDYLVDIVRQNDPVKRPFGILLKAEMSPVKPENANPLLAPSVQGFQRNGHFTFPVCLFFFTMRDDQGYYTWLLEPVITAQGKPKLTTRAAADCEPLNRDSLDRIVTRVGAWHEALVAELSA
jgi:hypothetical protein